MISSLRKIAGRKYFPLNEIEISKSALIHNYNHLNELSTVPVAPVLKSNAYGHGIEIVGKILAELNPPIICVDSIYEAYQLLNAKIKIPILVMGYVGGENLSVKKLPFSFSVYTEEMLENIKKFQPHAPVHIFVDSGMHREGVPMDDVRDFLKRAKSLNLNIEGIMSHFAKPDSPNYYKTKSQVDNFESAIEIGKKMGIKFKYIHLFASNGIRNIDKYKRVDTLTRSGKALYGIDVVKNSNEFLPVLSLNSTIIQIKELKKGESLGYDFIFKAPYNMTTAILPIGYNDGVNRRLSNKGFVKINNKFCRIIGRVSMNITVVDVTNVENIKVGQKVNIYSNNPMDKNCVFNVAEMTDTIPYEILTHLNPSTKRISIT